MALQINVSMTSKDGGTIATGAIVKFQTIFPESGTECHYNMKVYRNAQAITDKKDTVSPVEIPNLGYVKSISADEYTTLTPAVVHANLKAHLESLAGIGSGNVSIIV